jgi:hypothetical protein
MEEESFRPAYLSFLPAFLPAFLPVFLCSFSFFLLPYYITFLVTISFCTDISHHTKFLFSPHLLYKGCPVYFVKKKFSTYTFLTVVS